MKPRGQFLSAVTRVLVAALVTCGATGCISSKYRLAPKDTAAPRPLNLTGTVASESPPGVSATLHSVIVQKGPGSWKREAWWDEYVFSIVNHGAAPLQITGATLVDFQDQTAMPGDNPWALEKQSQTWWKHARSSQTASLLAIGAGAAVSAGAMTAAAYGSIMSGGMASAGAATAAGATLLALPVYAGAVIAINHHNKKAAAAEFASRRLVLPLTLEPGETRQGSLFFRLCPGPKRLVLHGGASRAEQDIAIDLSSLAGLHMEKPSAPPAAKK